MRTLLLTFALLVLIHDVSYSQTCPTYTKRNNGNGGTCADSDIIPSGKIRSGSFEFASASSLTAQKIEKNNVLVQENGVLISGTIFFGNLNGTSRDMCFYGSASNDNAVPAGNWRFTFVTSNNSILVCSYNFNSGGTLSTITAGSIGSDQTICSGQSPSSLSSVSAATNFTSYKWQSSTTSSNSGYTDIPSATSSSYSPGTLTQTTYFQRIAIDGTTEVASNVITVTVVSNTSWTGATNNTFGTTSNWNPAVSPTGCTITIPSSSNGTPQLASNVSLVGLTIESGKSIDLSGNNLTLTGAFINNGTISGTGNLIFGGSANQNISGIGSVKNVTINNASGVTITSDTLNVLGVFTPTSGRITTNNRLVFKATPTEEGTIGVYGGSCSGTPTNPFNGEVIVERFVPGNQRAFRFLTPGVTSSTSINSNWQEGGSNTSGRNYPYTLVSDQNPKLGYGTHITGSTNGINGLDATITGNPSMYTFNDDQTWSAITNTLTPTFKVGEAYRIMVRGSRAMNLNINDPVPDDAIIRTQGIPAFCDVTFNTSNAAPLRLVANPSGPSSTVYSFIGNPYWSVVDWHSVSKTDVQNFYYYWDPTALGTNRRGSFVTINISGSGDASDGSGPAQSRRYLQPGQAVLVKSTSSTPVITFSESNKNTSTSNKINVFQKNPVFAGGEDGEIESKRTRGVSVKKSEMIFVGLFLNQQSSRPADAVSLFYNENFSNSVGEDDATKLNNLDENIAFVAENQKLAFLGMKLVNEFRSDTIPISMWNLYDQNYILRFNLTNNVSQDREVLLLNRVTGETTKIPTNTVYDYSYTPPTGVKTNDQFALIFNTRPFVPKPRTRKDLSIFPNPVSNSSLINLNLPTGSIKLNQATTGKVEIYDMRGRIMTAARVQFVGEVPTSIDIGDLPSGSYTIRVSVNNKTHISNIIKQ